MKFCQRVPALFLALTITMSGQTMIQPGMPDLNHNAPSSFVQSDPNYFSRVAVVESNHEQNMKRLWLISIAAMFAGTSMDAATSWGRHEGNGLLAQSNGSFGAKGVGIKAGVAMASFVPQIIFRKHKELRTPFIVGNFAEAGIFAGTAIHNLNVK